MLGQVPAFPGGIQGLAHHKHQARVHAQVEGGVAQRRHRTVAQGAARIQTHPIQAVALGLFGLPAVHQRAETVEHAAADGERIGHAVVVKIHQSDARDAGGQHAREGQHGFAGVAQVAGDGRVRHSAAARPAPPVALRIRGHKRAEHTRKIHVKALHGDVIGVAVGGLHLVQVKARREEQHGLATRSLQGLVHIGGHAAGAGQNPQRGRFQHGKIAVAPAHAQHRLNAARVAVVGHGVAVLHGPHLHLVGSIGKGVALPGAGAVAQHGQGLVHAHHQGFAGAACEPLHFHFQVAAANPIRRNFGGQAVAGAGVLFAAFRQSGQHGGDVGEIFIGVPPAPHPFNIQLEGAVRQAFSVKDAHFGSLCAAIGVIYTLL